MKILKFLALTLVVLLILGAILLYEDDIPKDVVDARYSSPASQFLNLGDAGRIHFRDEGNRVDPAIVLLHGSNASLHTFEHWVERLQENYRVITLDLPGHGLTGETPAGEYNDQAAVRTVEALTDHLKLDQFVLGGNSMGGGVTWKFALAHPERVRGLVFIDSSIPKQWQEESDESSSVVIFELMRQGWFRSIGTKIDPYYLTAQGVRAAYNHSGMVNEALIMRYYNLNLREGTRRATIARFADYSTEDADLSVISVPVLIMWGEEDSVISVKNAHKLADMIPGSQTIIYKNVGHIPMEEIPELSATDLLTFLDALPI